MVFFWPMNNLKPMQRWIQIKTHWFYLCVIFVDIIIKSTLCCVTNVCMAHARLLTLLLPSIICPHPDSSEPWSTASALLPVCECILHSWWTNIIIRELIDTSPQVMSGPLALMRRRCIELLTKGFLIGCWKLRKRKRERKPCVFKHLQSSFCLQVIQMF